MHPSDFRVSRLIAIFVSAFSTIAVCQDKANSVASSEKENPSVEIVESSDFEKPSIVRLKLSASAEPQPALKYSLWPTFEEEKPGDSTAYYYRAVLHVVQSRDRLHKAMQEKYGNEYLKKWLDSRPYDLPLDGIRQYINNNAYSELQTAIHRERCDWDLRLHDLKGMDSIAFLLHEVQEVRDLGRMLSLKAKMEIAEGRLEDAMETLRTGYKMAHDVAHPRTLINDLVGIAIARIFNDLLLEIIAHPDSPNMYWALAQLPDPLVDIRPAMEYEMLIGMKIFPFLKDPENERRSPEQWSQFLVTAVSDLQSLGGSGNGEFGYLTGVKAQLVATAIALKGYSRAKRELVEKGYDREKLESMPVGQVIAIHESHVYRHVYHEMFKWSLLPFWQAYPKMQESEDRLHKEGYLTQASKSKEIVPIASLLLPASQAAQNAVVQFERDVKVLLAIEAIRMHASTNGGKLPKTLDEITIVPVPVDPLTARPFEYKVDGSMATISVTRPERMTLRSGRQRVYEITLRPSNNK